MFSKVVDPNKLREDTNSFYHISVTTLGEYKQEDLYRLVGISANILEQQQMEQPQVFVWWRRALASAKDKAKRAKDVRKRTYAKYASIARAEAKALKEKAPSLDVIDDYVQQQAEYIKANDNYREANKVQDDIEAVVETLRQRFEILKILKYDNVKHLKS